VPQRVEPTFERGSVQILAGDPHYESESSTGNARRMPLMPYQTVEHRTVLCGRAFQALPKSKKDSFQILGKMLGSRKAILPRHLLLYQVAIGMHSTRCCDAILGGKSLNCQCRREVQLRAGRCLRTPHSSTSVLSTTARSLIKLSREKYFHLIDSTMLVFEGSRDFLTVANVNHSVLYMVSQDQGRAINENVT